MLKNWTTLLTAKEIDKDFKYKDEVIGWEKYIFEFVLGFLLSNSNIFGEISPFGISICSAMSGEAYLSTSLGAMLGYILNRHDSIRYIISIFMIVILRWLFSNSRYMFPSTVTFLSTFISSILFLIMCGTASMYDLIMNISESMIATGATFFFVRTKKYIHDKTYYKGLSVNEITCILMSYSILSISLMSINILNISIGNIFCIFSVLFISFNLGVSGGAVIGIITSIIILLNGEESNGYVILSYSIGGLLGGAFRKSGRLGVSSVFILIYGFINILVNTTRQENILYSLNELFISAAIFVMFSRVIKSKMPLVKDNDIESLSCDSAKNLMLLKLSFASNTLHEIAGATQKVSEKLSRMSNTNIESIYSQCVAKICQKCELKMFCWNTTYNDTINYFNNMTPILKEKGKINKLEMKGFMQSRCRNIDDVIETVNSGYNRLIAKRGMERKVSEIRGVVTDQFDGMALMLRELAKEFCEIKEFDRQTSYKAKKVISNMGLNVYSITSFLDKYGRLTIEATTNIEKDLKKIGTALTLELSEVCERIFKLPCFTKFNNSMKITIIEKATYDVEFGVSQLTCNSAKDSGDSYDYFVDSKGKAHMILSDGMGTGGRAAIDGAMTTGLLSRLIKAGFEFEAALKMVNSALLVKSGDESLATVDVTSIDLYTGQTKIYKAGAAPTFAKKSDRVLEIESNSLPAGILRGVTFDKKHITLKHRDIVVMASDGVTDMGYEWIYDEIKSFNYNMSAEEFAKKIAMEAKIRRGKGKEDDVTVMVGIISKGV